MALILNIDTSLETASVSIAADGKILQAEINDVQKEHASFLHPAIEKIMKAAGLSLQQIDAIAVTEGPGSYTGLRVGMASAKGLSYALNKPFITVNTLAAIAATVIEAEQKNVLYAPMIDARRMEVFTAVYDQQLEIKMPPVAMVLHENSFSEFLSSQQIIFCGNGMPKWKTLVNSGNAAFSDVKDIFTSISILSHRKFTTKEFTDIAHSEPLYIKEFYNGK